MGTAVKRCDELLYTSSAGRSGMLLLTRVKNAIFSLKQTGNPHVRLKELSLVHVT